MAGQFLARRASLVSVSVAALLSAVPSVALAQAQPAGQDEVSEVVVTGVRRSLEDALQTKRNSEEIVDSISAEGIGKLPDLNLAESLQRLPGVQINRSAQRRGGTVSIRGLPGDFSQTLINGEYLASPDVSNFAFGNVRSEVFTGIDVQKAASAESLTGGLSGLVNLRTGSPLDSRDQASVTIDGRWEELQEKVAPGGAITFSRQIIPGVFGVRGAFGYKDLQFREDNAQINTYDRIAGAATADLADDVYAPRQVRLPTQKVTGESYSAALVAEWRPTEQLKGSLSGFYNDYRPTNYQSQFTLESRPTSVRTAIGTGTDDGRFGRTLNHISIVNPLIIVDSRLEESRLQTGALTGRLEWSDDVWTLQGVAHYTKAKRHGYTYGFQAQQQAAATGSNGYTIEIDTGAGSLGDFIYDMTPSNARVVNLAQTFGAPISPTFREVRATANPLLSFFGGFRNTREAEDELSLRFDVERTLDLGPIASVRAGAVYRDKSQSQFNALQTLFAANLTGLNNSVYDFSFLNGTGPFLNGRIGRFDRADYAELDVRRILDIIRPSSVTGLPSNASVGPGGIVQIIDTTALSQIYENDQKIYGGYAMVRLDHELSDMIRVKGNLGLRYEKSERSTVAQNNGTRLPFEYDNWLPSANLVFDIADDFVVRLSYSKTLRRPQVDSFAVLRSVAVDGTGLLVTANLGAGDLKPFTSENYDVSFEWYNRTGSSFSALFFRKDVKDYAGTTRICPADGGGFGFGPLTNASGVCRTVNTTPPGNGFPTVFTGATVNVNVTANQDDFRLQGFELSAQQNLSFLPAPWNGFGGQVNYTYVDFKSSSAFRLSEISKDTVNVIVYYETPRFGVRAAYNYRSAYFLASGGTASGADRYVKARPQLDLSGQYNINDRLTANFEIFNVTDEVLYEYEGAVDRARNYTVYGRTVSAGLTYRF